MTSPVYYNAKNGEASAIFVTCDDAHATLDHIHPHRTPLIAISPPIRNPDTLRSPSFRLRFA